MSYNIGEHNLHIMKRLIIIIFALFISISVVQAEDCMHDPVYDRDWNGVVTTGMRIRDIPCMESSVVLTTVPVGTVVKVIAETDGYYQVRLSDGTEGWSGQWLLEQTSQPFYSNEPQEPLFDVEGHDYETAVKYLGDNEIIEGYSDGSYKPDNTVNRAEFTKIIVGAKLGSNPTSYASNCFPDVPSSEWYASYVCYAKQAGIIGGYPDGTFKPGDTINLAEAAKILVNTLEVDIPEIESDLWYRQYIEAMQNSSYIPQSFSALDQNVTRGEMAEMTWRIMEEEKGQPFTQFNIIEEANEEEEEVSSNESEYTTCADSNLPSSIDMDAVRDAWLAWYNGSRSASGLHSYTYNGYLDYSAAVWSEYSNNVGVMSHTRPGQTDYYDYSIITSWFGDLGLTFANHSGVTYSENIGYATYRCSDSDCTQEMIDAIEPIYDAYMAEKGTSYTGHYDSVMNGYFNEIGLGLSIDSADETVYLTVHYATEIDSYPTGTCSL